MIFAQLGNMPFNFLKSGILFLKSCLFLIPIMLIMLTTQTGGRNDCLR